MRSPEDVSAMHCPVCRVPLAMSDRQGIEIDYCPQCRGVWLDRGELDKIVERSAPEAPAPAARPREDYRDGYREDHRGDYRDSHHGHGGYGHHGGRPHKRRKSFLEELFD